ncbi:MAG: hypothetical protein IPL46_07120 [Saprospiraceae bacterium]|nr:hypothetical protein [Saprospiraceae bacterium]
MELMKNRWNNERRTQFFFWQDSNKVEVDLLELDGIETHLYETKYSQTPSADFFKGIKSFRGTAPIQRQRGNNFAIYAGYERQPRADAIIEDWKNLP